MTSLAVLIVLSLQVSTAQQNSQTEEVLKAGFPVEINIPAAEIASFQYTTEDTEIEAVVFQMTAHMGHSRLFTSRSSSLPTIDAYDKVSDTPGNRVTYRKDRDSLVGTYHIAVYAQTETVASLVVCEYTLEGNTTMRLFGNRAQQGVLWKDVGSSALYRVDTSVFYPQTREVILSLTHLLGRTTLCAYGKDLHICAGEGPELRLPISELSSMKTMEVLVQGTQFAADLSVSYILCLSIEGRPMKLQEGVPFYDKVRESQYRYYEIALPGDFDSLSVLLTHISGEPDLYLLIDTSVVLPSRSKYHYKSNLYGSEELLLRRQQIFKYCQFACKASIGVYGFTDSVYTLRVSMRRERVTTLLPEVVSSGFLSSDEHAYFASLTTTSSGLLVYIQDIQGYSELYANVLDSSSTSDFPTRDHYHFISTATQNKQITLNSHSMQQRCVTGSCLVLIGVYCRDLTTSYSLALSQDQILPIPEGVPLISSSLAGAYTYFRFFSPVSTPSIRITVTSFTDEIPSLFVTHGKTTLPSFSVNTWKATSWRSEELLIPADSSDMRGFYVIGVHGYYNTTFSIVVATESTRITQLLSTLPIQAQSSSQKVRLFRYFNWRNENIFIHFTPLYGISGVKVSTSSIYTDMDIHFQHESLWSTESSAHPQSLEISSKDAHFCTNCLFLISVITYSEVTYFSLSVSVRSEALVLQRGIPLLGYVNHEDWRYYHFFTFMETDIDISVLNLSGNTDIIAGSSRALDKESVIWRQSSSSQLTHMIIARSDPNYIIGEYWVGVHGNSSSSYTLTAHSNSGFAMLIDGLPVSYTLEYEKHVKFEYYVMTSEPVICSLSSSHISPLVTVYISFAEVSESNLLPDPRPASYQDTFTTHNNDNIYGALSFMLPAQNHSGDHVLAVYNHGNEGGVFQLTCWKEDSLVMLVPGSIQYGTIIEPIRKKQFRILASEPGLMQVSVSGDVNVTISNSPFYEESTDIDIITTKTLEGKYMIEAVNLIGSYYLTLSLKEANYKAKYELEYLFSPKNTRIPPTILPGNDGLLTWTNINKSVIHLHWDPPIHINGSVLSHTPAYYQLYISHSGQACLGSLLDIQDALDHGIAFAVRHNDISNTTAVLAFDSYYKVNVVFVVYMESRLVRVLYTATEIAFVGVYQGIGWGLIVCVGVGITVTAAGIAVVWWKYRAAQRKKIQEAEISRQLLGSEPIRAKQTFELA